MAASAAVYLFGAGAFIAFIIYSLVGAGFTMMAAWMQFRCVERRERQTDLIAAQ